MKLTFVDAGVLIAAIRGTQEIATRAMQVLDDREREFASSIFVRLEVLPKAMYHRNRREIEFYEAFFKSVRHWAEPVAQLTAVAYEEAVQSGLSAMDALHVAAASTVKADEFVTTEKRTRPIHRVTSVLVRSIRP